MLVISAFNECDELTSGDFERFVGAVLEACGWSGLTYTQMNQGGEHGDGGIDIMARRSGRAFAIEVKQRSPENKVGVTELSQLHMGADLRRIKYRILITNGYFTSDAKRRAFKLGITLVDRETLRTWWQTQSAELGRAVKPRKYQAAILEELVERFDRGERGFFVELATGLGKTYLAAFFARELLRREELKGGRVLFVAHQIELLEQASSSFRNVLGVGGYSYSACFDGSELRDTDLVFASFATLHQTISKTDPGAFDIVIVDEAHHSAARTYSRVIEHLQPRALLGLSATPFRTDDKDVLGFFGGESAIAGRRDVLWAIRHGYLARPRYKVFLDDIDPERLQLIRTGLSLRDLDRTLFLEKRDDEIVRLTYEQIAEAGIQDVRGIVFCRSIRHMQTLIDAFPPGSATLVHSNGMAADTRAANIRAFREGHYQFILVRDLFNEGVDIPETNVLVFLRSTHSRTIWLQQLGRGLRKTETKKDVHVLDFVGSIDRLNEVRVFDQALREVEVDSEEIRDPDGDIVLDRDLRVQYDQRAADVRVLLERFEFELASRANIVARVEERIAMGADFPSAPELPSLTGSSSDQIATLFGTYARLADRVLGDEASAELVREQVRDVYTKMRSRLGVEVSVESVLAQLRWGDLAFGSAARIRAIQLELFEEWEAGELMAREPVIHDQSPAQGDDIPHGDDDSEREENALSELIERYRGLIHSRADLRQLNTTERDLARLHLGSLEAFLDRILLNHGE